MPNVDLLPALRDLAAGHRTAYATVHYDGDTAEILHIGSTRQPNEQHPDRITSDAWKALIDVGLVALPEQGTSPDGTYAGRCTVTEAGYRALAAHR